MVALSTVTVDFNAGEVVGLVGGNGAGKTTLLRLLCGLYQPSSGSVQGVVDEKPVDIHRMREHVGVVPEATGLYARLTAWENIRYHSRLNGIDDDLAWTRTERFAKLLNFDHDLHRSTRGFSRGMRQKTALLGVVSWPEDSATGRAHRGLGCHQRTHGSKTGSQTGRRGGYCHLQHP